VETPRAPIDAEVMVIV